MTTQNLVTSLLRIKQAFMLSTIPLGEYITIHLFFCHLGCLGLIFPLQTVKYTLTHVHWQTLPRGLLVPICFPPGTYLETQGTNDLTIQDTIKLSSRRIKQLTLHHLEQALAAKTTSHLSTVNYLSASMHTCAGHPRFLSSEMSAHFCQLFLSGCLFHIYSSSLQILDTKLSLFQVRQIPSQLMACFYFLLESFGRHAQFSQRYMYQPFPLWVLSSVSYVKKPSCTQSERDVIPFFYKFQHYFYFQPRCSNGDPIYPHICNNQNEKTNHRLYKKIVCFWDKKATNDTEAWKTGKDQCSPGPALRVSRKARLEHMKVTSLPPIN